LRKRKKIVVGSFIAKRSCWTKVEMAMVKVEKATIKEAREAKKLAKLVVMAELGFVKMLPMTPKDEREETSMPFNLQSGEKKTSTRKECSKGEASKDNVQMVEQL